MLLDIGRHKAFLYIRVSSNKNWCKGMFFFNNAKFRRRDLHFFDFLLLQISVFLPLVRTCYKAIAKCISFARVTKPLQKCIRSHALQANEKWGKVCTPYKVALRCAKWVCRSDEVALRCAK
jgi:hypothetical protein